MIDCDVHSVVQDIAVLEPYLDEHWRAVIATTQFSGPTDQAHPPNLRTSLRADLEPVEGRPPGATLASVRNQLLDPLGLQCAVLSCDYAVDAVRNPDAAAALARAVNDWQLAEWLAPEPRLRGAIVLAPQLPTEAAAEVRRCAEHQEFVAAYLPVRSAIPYGNRHWWPLLEAIAAQGLVLELHFGGSPGLAPTASGWPGTWLEEYVDMASAFQAQLTSLVAEGAFERFPALRVTLVESGFAWLPAFLWRFDKSWRGLRREIPWTRRAPSAYVREHVRIAIQPFDGPSDPARLRALLDQLDAERLLLYASDYPHAHTREGLDALPACLSAAARETILDRNAREHYRL